MDYLKENWKKITLFSLVFLNIVVWTSYLSQGLHKDLKVVFLNVGQGDAIYIRAPGGNDMLIDAGPRDKSVLRELGAVMPWSDHDIDVILETHADADHIGGFPDVLKRFSVGAIVESGNHSKTNQIDGQIEDLVKTKKVPEVIAKRGMIINLGNSVKFTILFPDQNIIGWETNVGSIVGVLSYGSRKFLLTGDSPQKIENYLAGIALQNNEDLKVDVLKPGHHGSKTSTSELFLEITMPQYAVISAGKNNRYGHPNKETIDKLNKFKIKIFETMNNGRIEFDTNGTDLTPRLQFTN